MSATKRSQTKTVWQHILSFFQIESAEERIKRNAMKHIANRLQNNSSRYFNRRTGMMLPKFAEELLSYYRLLLVDQQRLSNAYKSKVLQQSIVYTFLPQECVDLLEQLAQEGEHYDERAMSQTTEALERLRRQIAKLPANLYHRIDSFYNMICMVLDVMHFNYQKLLRSFDSTFSIGNMLNVPRFSPTAGDRIIDQLEDLLVIAKYDVDLKYIEPISEIIRQYFGETALSKESLRKVLIELKRLSVHIHDIVAYLSGNADYRSPRVNAAQPIARPMLESMQGVIASKVREASKRLEKERKRRKIVDSLYGRNVELGKQLPNYHSANSRFPEEFPVFSHSEMCEHYLLFCATYFDDMRDFIQRIFVLKAEWYDGKRVRSVSNALDGITRSIESLRDLDEQFAPEGEIGKIFSKILRRLETNEEVGERYYKKAMIDIDNRVVVILRAGQKSIDALAHELQLLLEDLRANEPQLLINWEQLVSIANNKLEVKMKSIITKLTNCSRLVNLMSDALS